MNGAERYLHYEAKGRRIGVYCRLCGLGPYHYLGNHVFNTHGIRSSEYRKRFPDADMTPPEYRTAIHQELIDKGSRPGSKGRSRRCKRGHPLVGSNVMITSTGRRRCRECHYAQSKAAHAQWRERILAQAVAEQGWILCECGCGTRIPPVDTSGRPRRYRQGHGKRDWHDRFTQG